MKEISLIQNKQKNYAADHSTVAFSTYSFYTSSLSTDSITTNVLQFFLFILHFLRHLMWI